VNIRNCVNTVLNEAKSSTRCKIPTGINDMDVAVLQSIKDLLEPMAVLTDQLQGDGVTASTVIPQLIFAVKRN